MSQFKIVNSANDITLGNKWVPVTQFKHSIVDAHGKKIGANHQGHKYQIIEKRERTFSKPERVGRGILGVAIILSTLCFALFSKWVRNLVTKPSESIRFAVLKPNSSVSQSNPSTLSSIHTSTVTKVTPTSKDLLKEKIEKELTPQMVAALGGIDKVLEFPILDEWNGDLKVKHIQAPVVRGYHKDGRPFLLFCYYQNGIATGEYLGRDKNGGWEGAYSCPSELNLRSPNSIADGSLAEKFMLDKIQRLMKGEAVGVVEQFPGVVLFKPSNKAHYMPNDAYLTGNDLLDYMDQDTIFYEKKPADGATGLFLYDQRLSSQANWEALEKKFPVTT